MKNFKEYLEEKKHWGSDGAGCLLYAQSSQKFLMPLRSKEVLEPNRWGLWGGKIEKRMTAEQTVRQELYEEIGMRIPEIKLIELFTYKDKKFTFRNFVFVTDNHDFKPKLNWETKKAKWVSFDNLKFLWPKHFGLKALLNDNNSINILRNL